MFGSDHGKDEKFICTSQAEIEMKQKGSNSRKGSGEPSKARWPPFIYSPMKSLYGLFCIGAFTVHTSLTIVHYFQYDTKTEVTSSFDLTAMDYPSLTLCNTNKFKKSFLMLNLGRNMTSNKDLKFDKEELQDLENDIPGDKLQDAGHSYESMILEQMGPVFYSLQEWTWLHDYGNCYTITPNDTHSLDNRMSYHKEISTFRIGFDLDEITSVANAEPPGVLVVTDLYDNIRQLDKTAVTINPGNKYIIRIKISTTIRLESPFWTSCVVYADIDLEDNRERCFHNCVASVMNQTCGCFLSLLHKTNSTAPYKCGPDFEESEECFGALDDIEHLCHKECPLSCRDTDYEIHVHRVPGRICKTNDNECKKRRQSARVIIIWESLTRKLTEVKPDIKVISLLSNIGGCFGLWLGASIMTMPQYFYQLSKYLCKKKKKKEKEEK